MWRGGGVQKTKQDDGQLVVVGIDGDKSSQHALKWAADHLISKNQVFILLHVRKKINTIPTPSGQQLPISEVDDEIAAAFLEQINFQTRELLLPFQCFCNKRGLQCKEVVLDGTDVPKAIASYVEQQSADKLVLGASSRGALARAFKQADVPTSLSKLAPEFCSVYVIAKGKISSVRPALRGSKPAVKRQTSFKFESPRSSFGSPKCEPVPRQHMEAIGQSPMARSTKNMHNNDRWGYGLNYENMVNERLSRVGQGGGNLNFSYQSMSSSSSPGSSSIDQPFGYSSRDHNDFRGRQSTSSMNSLSSCPSPSRSSTDRPISHLPRDHPDVRGRQSRFSMQNEYSYSDDQMRSFESNRSGGQYWSNGSGSSGYGHVQSSTSQEFGGASWSANSMEDVDAEMKRINLELKQKMDLYNTSDMENLRSKQKGRDPYSFQTEDYQRNEGSRSSEASIGMTEEKPWSREALRSHAAEKMGEVEATKNIAEKKLLLEEEEKRKIIEKLSMDVRYRRYTIEDVEKATDNYSEKLKIGEGGYGPVFKSTLDHTVVAIKILRSDATQGMKQFQQEIEVLSCIRHPNMVLLMGACPENGCLVYEYMANGSLEDRLFCRSKTPPLSWQLRFKIAAEIATGLLFLHETKPEPLVHRDLKPGNILLDHNFVSKIADVGLARLIPPAAADAVTQYRMTAAAGTFCYIDPEYQQTGLLGIKSDIYALGIILLQLITGTPPMGLAHNVERALEMGRFERMLDAKVPDWPMEETMKFVKLGLKCAELRRKDRPDLGTVVLPELNNLREFAEQSQAMGVYPHWPMPGNQELVSVAGGCPGSRDDVVDDDDDDDDMVKSPFMR